MACDGTNKYFYLNGDLKHTSTYTTIDYAQSNNAFVIGKMAYSYTNTGAYFPFNGQISDVRIYVTTLSADDVLELYKQGRTTS